MKQGAQTAREMTEEINRVTDAERVGDAAGRGNMSPERARGIGGLAMGQVLTYNPEHLGQRERAENERVREIAEIDNGYARNEIAPNLSSVGEESALEEAERLADDRENYLSELDPGRSFEAKIQANSQEEIAKEAAVEMGKLLRQKSFAPSALEEYRFRGMKRMMGAFAQPREFGERNG